MVWSINWQEIAESQSSQFVWMNIFFQLLETKVVNWKSFSDRERTCIRLNLRANYILYESKCDDFSWSIHFRIFFIESTKWHLRTSTKGFGGVYLLSTRHTTNPNTEIVLIGYFGSSIKTWILENIFPPIDLITDMLWKLAILENYMLK